MNKNTMFKVGFILMILLNAVLIFLLLKPHPLHPPQHAKGSFKDKIRNTLMLDDQQQDRFEELAKEHHDTMMKINKEQKELVRTYFNFLKTEGAQVWNQGELMKQIQQFESKKVEATFQHFQDLKGICTKDQLTRFDEIIDEITSVLLNNKQNNQPPPRDF